MESKEKSQESAKRAKPKERLPNVDAASFFSLGGEFLEAARVLVNTPPTRMGYQSVSYYLLGHAAELYLKSYLCARGVGAQELIKIGHDLKRLISKCKRCGLSGVGDLPALRSIGTQYRQKALEYRELKAQKYPPIDQLMAEVKALSDLTLPTFDWNEVSA